jgi:hypothetical protein
VDFVYSDGKTNVQRNALIHHSSFRIHHSNIDHPAFIISVASSARNRRKERNLITVIYRRIGARHLLVHGCTDPVHFCELLRPGTAAADERLPQAGKVDHALLQRKLFARRS